MAFSVTVSSISELKEYLDVDSVDVVMTAGIYTITADDGATDVVINDVTRKVLLYFEGSNSTYDFTDVTINVETSVAQSLGYYDVYEINICGNNNVLSNLTLVDDGDEDDAPTYRATNIVMDGSGNTIEGFNMTITGSYPYGYGDAFGKGGGAVISHHKRSALLVRGESNSVLNCTLIHRSYGHAIYMQSATSPTIEGCYIEGEVRTTDDMLAEEGTGSAADSVDFMTIWEYTLPSGYMMSLGEAGIRAYNAGVTVIDGVEYSGGTTDPTIKDCTIKYMRKGVGISFATGTETISGCTCIGCETAYDFDGDNFSDNTADISYGPAFNTVNDDQTFDITIFQSLSDTYNGSGCIGFIGGDNDDITLNCDECDIDESLQLYVGGNANTVRDQADDATTYTASNCTISNLTSFPILLTDESSSIAGESCGDITDNGSDNSVSSTTTGCPCDFPDSDKIYYIDCPKWDLRLAATGESEDAYTTSTSTTGDDVEWKFTDNGNGYWYLDRAAGGSLPRLRTDNTEDADMQSIATDDSTTYYDFTDGKYSNSYYLTLIDGPSDYNRLEINSDGEVKMVPDTYTGGWESFTITEVAESTALSSSSSSSDLLESNEAVEIYPNPFSSQLTINNSKGGYITICNAMGKIVYCAEINSDSEKLNLNTLPEGLYLTKIQINGKTNNFKIVKQ
jgi:hypothetical protein